MGSQRVDEFPKMHERCWLLQWFCGQSQLKILNPNEIENGQPSNSDFDLGPGDDILAAPSLVDESFSRLFTYVPFVDES